ncbi:MAG: hypothetical protein KDC87_08265 [Planctomycetes bacterium]|nr:hypothetical protein [Planctomycetota bacterium]MCB9869315.1 hypothetical protein [Planctomycetota bacterium]
MRLFLNSTLFLACTATLAAQTYRSSPDGFLSSEGELKAYMFGEWANAREMFLDGTARNNVMVLKGVDLRADNFNYGASTGTARTFSRITLDIAPCNFATPSTNFSSNPTSTPTRVFSASVTLPGRTGFPTSTPAPWDINFAFTNTWIYNGATDICLDFEFQGGVLANASTQWWPKPCAYETYYVDAPNTGNIGEGAFKQHGTGCTDSAHTSPGTGWVTTKVYNSMAPKNQNMYEVYSSTSYTANNALVLHAFSFFPDTTGQVFPGVACEKVFMDLTKPIYLFPTTAGTGGTRAYINYPLIPYQKIFEGTNVVVQGVWDDSVTNQTKFTYAESNILPKMPGTYSRAMLYSCDTANYVSGRQDPVTGTTIITEATHNPIFRYVQ